MSAVVSIIYDDCIQIMTDGAAYRDGILEAVVKKYHPARTKPFVVTGRGNQHMVEHIAKAVTEFCDEEGSVDLAFDWLEHAARRIGDRIEDIGNKHFEVYAHGYSERSGFVQKALFSHALGNYTPFELHDQGKVFSAAPDLTYSQMLAFAGEFPETDSTFLPRRGLQMMEFMRLDMTDAKIKFEDGPKEWSCVGGHCALTTVTKTGVTSRMLKVWDDPIGEKINPYRNTNVTRLPNRKERRAAKRRMA
ncbi:hypothetical protein [Rhizobium sp. Leaf453]|uniref:hypothetical protein n=1 Tax=Rhizobium sp. Leaf453 TaxID=1736380 RepID=UPI0007158808|nr:hypothetical protein [Rhizobium sp. Leaf453]KQT96984.1 hypothetical protein ASG68_08485 [Rhizobium sp. Leaf453]